MVKHHASLLLLGGILGVLGFFLAPGYLRPYTFFIPLFILCIVFVNSKSDIKFNFKLFLIVGIVVLMLPSNFVTLDSSSPYASKNTLDAMINLEMTFGAFVLVGLPTIWGIAGLYLILVAQQIKTGLKLILEALLAVVVTLAALMILINSGTLPDYGLLSTIQDLYEWLIGSFSGVTDTFSNFLSAFETDDPVTGKGFSVPDADESYQFMFDYNTNNPQPGAIAITVSLISPFIIGGMCLITGIHALFRKKEKGGYQAFIDNYLILSKDDKIEPWKFTFRKNINLGMIMLLGIIFVIGFGLYLSMSEPGYDVSVFGIYFTLDLLCIYVLSQNLIPYRQRNIKDFLLWFLIGVGGIFIVMQMFVAEPLNVLLSMEDSGVSTNIITQWVLVAPTESLFFHIFLPGLMLTYMLLKYRKQTFQMEGTTFFKEDVQEVRDSLYLKWLKEKSPKKRDKIQTQLNELDFYLLQTNEIDLNKFIYSDPRYLMFLFISFLIPNIIFAIYHNFYSGMDTLTFFTFGPGLIYLSAGVYISAICWFGDWRSGIAAHAAANTIMIFMGSLI